jgi:hypothetical protein
MAKEYDDTNRGVLFPNDRKQKSSHPDFKGNATIKTPDGELIEVWVSGWEKEGRKGPFLSLSFQLKEDKEEQEERPVKKQSSLFGKKAATEDDPPIKKKKPTDEDLDDAVPF